MSDRKPTAAMAANAERGLKLREQHNRGGTEVGVNRARQLAAREPLSDDDVKSMYSYFARHEVDKQAPHFGDRDEPSAGYIAWLLWGGDEGKAFIDREHAKMEADA